MTDSHTLLAEYVRTGSETAFCELVTRYVDLVYSTALRLAEGDTHRAEDIAQVVFVDLARAARTLSCEVMLGGWLHRDTCFVAAKTLRAERRRQSRERQAVEMNALQDNPGVSFSLIAPILDEAINELGEADRTAILLRFFEQHDYRSVGEALGSNEDAARMRVTRALDKLQGLLKRRGVTTSAATLCLVLSANAIQAAPVGLALTISTVAAFSGTTITTTTIATATKAIVMTTIQKGLVTATLAILAGAGIYEARQASRLQNRVQSLQQRQTPLSEQIHQLQRERDAVATRLAALADEMDRGKGNSSELLKLRGEVARLRTEAEESKRQKATGQSGANDPVESKAKSWLARVNLLKERVAQKPEAKIPEFQFLTEEDWLNVAQRDLGTETDERKMLSRLRNAAENRLVSILQPALLQYIQANNSQFPTDLAQLQPYFESPVTDVVLQRWKVAPADEFPNFPLGGDWVVTQKSPVDEDYDSRIAFNPSGSFGTGFKALKPPRR
jgi:RNA polymerase sigma factor (sigma-70 family)